MRHLIFLLLLPIITFSQSPLNWYWARSSGGTAYAYGTGVATDSSGNVFVTGYFGQDTIIFGRDTLYHAYRNLNNFFIVKYSSSGNVLWAKNASLPDSASILSYSIATDVAGNAYITGQYSGNQVTLGDSVLPNTSLNGANSASFIAKYDASGNALWVKAATNEPGNNFSYGYSIAVDGNGNSYSTGKFTGASLRFDGININNNNGSSTALYVVKYNNAGNVLWAKIIDCSGNSFAIALDGNNNAYITGDFSTDSVSFDNITLYANNDNNTNYFIAKYNSSGNVLWAKGASGNGECEGLGVTTDRDNNIYITGSFSGTFNFGEGVAINGYQGSLIVKYNDSGNAIWGKASGGNSVSSGISVATDSVNNLYVAGSFDAGNSVSFDSIVLLAPGSAQTPAYIFTFDSSGQVICASWLSNGIYNDKFGICVDKNGNGYIAADFDISLFVVGPDTLHLSGTPEETEDVYVAKFLCPNCANGDTFTYQLTPAVLCPGDSARISFGDYSQLRIAAGNNIVRWVDTLDAILKPDTITTFTVSGYLACGGFHSQSFTLPVVSPNITITSNANTICYGDSVEVCATAGYSSYSWNPPVGGTTGACIEAKSTGSYSVTATENSGGCTAQSNSLSITVDQPQASITANPSAICPGDSSQICATPGFLYYVWGNSNNRCIYVKQSGTYTVTVVDNNICTAQSNSLTINTAQAPSVSISANPDTICAGGSTQICPNGNFASYAWSPAPGGASTQCIEAQNTGIYTLTVTDSHGCTAQSNQLRIYPGQPPTVTISANPDTICAGGSAQICPNSNFSIYAWSNNVSTQCEQAQNAGVYTLTVTDSHGCTAQSNQLRIYPGQPPSVAISANPDTICAGGSAQICPNGNFAAYQWSPASGGAGTQCIEAQNAGVYTLTVTDSHGCTAQSNSLRIYSGQAPSVTISAAPDTICGGDSAQICANGNFSSYTWSSPAAAGQGVTQCIETGNTGNYSLMITDNNGCTAQSNSLTIYGGQVPTATVSANHDTICPGDSVQICASGNFSLYRWNPSYSGAQALCIETQTPGTYYIRAAGNNGCSVESNSVIISSGQIATPTLTANEDSICIGDSAQICATQGFATYTWSPAMGGTTTNCIQVQSPGAYGVAVTDNSGCTAQSNSIGITVMQTPTVIIGASSDSICTGDSAQICATQGFGTYTWNPAIGGATGNCIQVQNPGAYSVAVTDNNGCTAQSNSVSIVVGQLLSVNIGAYPDTICNGDSAEICAGTNFATYIWSPAIGGAGHSQCIEAKNAGNYSVLVTDNAGCTGQSNIVGITVMQTPTPTINASADSICPNDSAKLCAAQGFAMYVWGSPAAAGQGAGACIEVRSAGNYDVSVSDNFGCTAQSNSIGIAVRRPPTAFIKTNTDTICPGDSAQICSTTTDSLYNWSVGLSTKCIAAENAGDYYVTVTDNKGCTAESNHIGITTLPSPQVSISENGDTLIANNAIGCQWYFNDTIIHGATKNIYVAHVSGTYTVSVTDSDGCSGFSSPIIYTGVSEINEDDNFIIYPNPLSVGKWQMAVGNEYIGALVEILAADGRLVYKSEIKNTHTEIDAPFAGGVYLLRIISGTSVVVRKLVKL